MRLRPAPALAAAVALLWGCGKGEDAFQGPPVLVIGIDGLEWSVLEPLMASGEAPNFKALVERGVAGELETLVPTYSPVVWTTIATGATPDEHGVHFFNSFDADGKPGLPNTSNSRRVPAIWNVADDAGRSSLCVAWWVSWPAEPLRHGRVVASYAAQAQGNLLWKAGVWTDGLPELTWPASLQQQILPALHDGAPDGPLRADYDAAFGRVPEQWKWDQDLDARFRMVYHADRTHLRITLEQLRQKPADLNMVYFGLPDVAGHFFWRYHEPDAYQFEVPADRVAQFHDRVRAAYRQADAWLGQLVAAAPPDARVLVVSDHGMHANRAITPDKKWENIQSGFHEDGPPGVAILAGPDIPARGLLPAGQRRIGSVYDVFPTLLDWLGMAQPPAGEGSGQPWRSWMSPEWQQAHPLQRGKSYRAGFRAPTPPRLPTEDADQVFLQSMNEIGYATSGGAAGSTSENNR